MGLEQQNRSRRLVDLARLDSDQAVLEVVDTADPVFAADAVESGDQFQRCHRLTVERNRQALFETNLDISRFIRAMPRILGPAVNVGRRLGPGVFQRTGFDGSAPQVLIGRVRGADRGRHLDAVLGRVFDLVVAIHVPLTHWRDHLQLRRERSGGDVEAHLVVALAGAPVGDRDRAFATRDLDHHGRDQRPPERGGQGILLLVYGAGLQGWPDEELEKWRAAVGDVGRRSAGIERPGLDGVEVLFFA